MLEGTMGLDLPIIAAAARGIAAIGTTVLPHARRLLHEKQAAQLLGSGASDLLDEYFSGTLSRLTGPQFDDAWWRDMLARAEHAFVAPDFFKIPAVRTWLLNPETQEGIRSLARARVLGVAEDGSVQARLGQHYAVETGERKEFASVPVEAAVSALIAGACSELSGPSRVLAAFVQAGDRAILEEVTAIRGQLEPPVAVRDLANEKVRGILDRLKKRRGFDRDETRSEIS